MILDEKSIGKGYVEEIYYLGKIALMSKIMVSAAKKTYSMDELINHYKEVFEPLDRVDTRNCRFTELKFLINFTQGKMKKKGDEFKGFVEYLV